jgi:malonate transporter and related proteins
MLNVLAITSPVFLLIGLGYAAVRMGLIEKTAMRPLGAFVITFALPALIFKSLAQRPIAEIASAGYLAAYGGGSLIAYSLLFALARRQGKALTPAAIHALGGAISNSAFIGYPLVTLALGPVAAVSMALNMIIENLVMMPLALTLAESGTNGGGRLRDVISGTALRLVKNPLIISICAGTALSLLGVPPSGPFAKALDLLAAASAPVALFTIGGTLAGLPVRGMFGDAAQIAFAKLIVHPLAVFACLRMVPVLSPELYKACVIFAGMPMAAIYPLLAQPYGRAEQSAAALALATALSFVTISALLLMVR